MLRESVRLYPKQVESGSHAKFPKRWFNRTHSQASTAVPSTCILARHLIHACLYNPNRSS